MEAIQGDLLEMDLGEGRYDLVVSIFFLERDLFPGIMRALKPGGYFIMQTYSRDQLQFEYGPRNPDFLLAPNELLGHFQEHRIRHYEDRVVETPDSASRKSALVRIVIENFPLRKT